MRIPRPTFVIPIHGTWSLNQVHPWWKTGSDFQKFARECNIFYKEVDDEPFTWSGRIDGINWKTVLTLGFSKDVHDDWRTAGFALRYYLQRVKLEDRNLILHSHAWPVYLYSRMPVKNIITIGSPMRADLKPLAEQAKALKLYNYHAHIYDMVWDKIAYLGQLGDGKWFGSRHCDTADMNIRLKGISHSKVLTDPQYITDWMKEGWFDILRTDWRPK